MEEKATNKIKLKRSQRRLIHFSAVLILTLLFLQVLLYFGSDLLLRSYIQNKVDEASDGKYEVSFDRFRLSLFQRGFYFEGFSLSPNKGNDYWEDDKPIYRVQVPKISVKRLSFDFGEKILRLGEVRFEGPNIQTRQDLQETDSVSSVSRLDEFQAELRKSLEQVPLEDLVIGNLYLDDADLLIENFVSQKSIRAFNTNFQLKEIHFLKDRPLKTPFNAEGFTLELENFEMLLADSIHLLNAEQIRISSLDSIISASRLSLTPDLTKPGEQYYEVHLENLQLSQADINRVFYTTNVDIGSLNLKRPEFIVYSELSPDTKDEYLSDYSLYPLMKDILASISIIDLNIDEGHFLQRGVKDEFKNRIEVAKIDFAMQQVYIGPDESRNENQFFYADQATLNMQGVKVVLADGIHWLTGEEVYLSSSEDVVKVKGARMEPFRETDGSKTLIEVSIPEFNLEQAHLKKVYNENILDVKDFIIRKPSVQFTNVQAREQQMEGQTIKELSKNFLRGIYIGSLKLLEGDMTLNNTLQANKDSVSFEKVTMILENFAVDERTEKNNSSRMFLAEDLQLVLDNYAMKLTDDLHLLKAERIFIDTKAQLLKIDGFSFEPLMPDQVMENLQRLGKRTVLDIQVPEFYLKGIDIRKAYFDGELKIKLVEVPSPDIRLSRYMARSADEGKVEINDLYTLATSYFSSVKIDSLSLEEGSIAYDNFVRDSIKTFAEDNVSIRIKNFMLDEEISPRNAETFFAEELDISLNNYVFNVADGKYSLHADKISYNSSRDELITSNVRLRPRRDLGVKVTLGADISNLSFIGVDMDRFFFDNTLAMSKVKMVDAEVNLFLDRGEQKSQSPTGSAKKPRARSLPKRLDVIQIDTIEAENARFNVFFSNKSSEHNLIETGINLSFYGFLLDSARLHKGDIIGFFDNMSMEIDDFSLALQDSIHTLGFSKVELDTKSDLIHIQDLRVEPNRYSGSPGKPIIEGFIPLVTLKTQSIADFQETGSLDIDEMILNDPELKIYLDQKENKGAGITNLDSTVQQVVKQLHIEEFHLNRGMVAVHEKDSEHMVRSFNGLNVALSDLSFDLSKAADFDKSVFLNKDFSIELPEYEIMLPDSMNVLKIGLIVLSHDKMQLKDLEFLPRYGRYEYMRRMGSQTDYVQASIPEICFNDIDLIHLIEDREVIARSMWVHDPDISVFRDKRVVFNDSIFRPMPQQLMRSSGISMALDTLKMYGGEVVYEEFPEKGMVPGKIMFDSLHAWIYPFHLAKTLDSDYLPDTTFLKATARIHGVAPLVLDVAMSYDSPYPMFVDVKTGTFDLDVVNTIMAPNAFLKVREGRVKPSHWTFTADNEKAVGSMRLYYNGLKVQLLDERTLKRARGRMAMLNFVLNAFAARGNNPRKLFNRLVEAPVYFERDDRKFIFNYWWKASLSGFKGSLGLGHAGPARKEEEDEK